MARKLQMGTCTARSLILVVVWAITLVYSEDIYNQCSPPQPSYLFENFSARNDTLNSICGESVGSLLLEAAREDVFLNGFRVDWMSACQEEFDDFALYDYSGAYDSSSANFPPRVGGSGWALLMDGEGDILRGFISAEAMPTRGLTWMWWAQATEYSIFHEIFNIAASDSEDHVFSIVCEYILDVWVSGVSAITYDVSTNHHFNNVAFPGHWMHVAITWDSNSDAYIYINGNLVSVSVMPTGLDFKAVLSDVVVGGTCQRGELGTCGSFTPQSAWGGMFDELQVYDYALTEEQINATFSKGERASPLPILDLSLNLEGGRGRVAIDQSTHEHNLDFFGKDTSSIAHLVVPSEESLFVPYWDLREADDGAGPTWVASTVPTIGLGDFVFSVPRDQELAVVLPAMDPDNDTLVWFIEEAPLNGTLYQTTDGVVRGDVLTSGMEVSHPGGMVIYVPNQDAFNGVPLEEWAMHSDVNPIRDRFVYCVKDTAGHHECSDAIVLQNLPPFARSESYWIQEDADLLTFFPCFDQDGDIPRVVITSYDGNGRLFDHDYHVFLFPPEEVYTTHNVRAYPHNRITLRRLAPFYGAEITEFPYFLNDTGRRVIFAPAEEDFGFDYCNITYYCVDHFGQISNEASLSFDVFTVNDPPIPMNLAVDADEDETEIIHLQATDPDDTRLHYTITAIPEPIAGTLYTVTADGSLGEPIASFNVATNLIQFASAASVQAPESVVAETGLYRVAETLQKDDTGLVLNKDGILGSPDHYPASGHSAYTAEVGYPAVINLEYDHAFFVTEIWVYETKSPGSIVKISFVVKTKSGDFEVVVWEGIDLPAGDNDVRVFKPDFCAIAEPIRYVRLYTDPVATGTMSPNIDAVAVVGTMTEDANRLEGNRVAFVPRENFFGSTSFRYTAGDCSVDANSDAEVSLFVAPKNDAPAISSYDAVIFPGCDALTPLDFHVTDVDTHQEFVKTSIVDFPESKLVLYSSTSFPISRSMLPYVLRDAETIFVCAQPALECDVRKNLNVTIVATDGQLSSEHEVNIFCDPIPRVSTVVLGVLLPLHAKDSTTGEFSRYMAGTEALAAVHMAVNEINNKTDGISDHLLPRTTIQYVFNDTRFISGTAREGAQHMLKQKIDDVPVTAFICCEDATLSKDVYETVSASRNVLQMSYLAATPEFSSTDTYTYFYRVIPAIEDHAMMIIETLYINGWTRFSIIHEDTPNWRLTKDFILDNAKAFDLDIMRVVEVSKAMADARIESDMVSLYNTSIILLFCESTCSSVQSVATSLNITGDGQGFTWFTITALIGSPPGAWTADMRGGFYTELCDLRDESTCTDIDANYSGSTGDTGEPQCTSTSFERWRSQPPICNDISECVCSEETDELGNPLWREYDGSECLGIEFKRNPSLYSSYLYDAVYAFAYAVHEAVPNTDSEILSTSALAATMKSIFLTGSTGALSFTDQGNRGSGVCVSLYNFRGVEDVTIVADWYGENGGYQNCSQISRAGIQECQEVVYATADQSEPNAYCPDEYYLDVSDPASETYLFCLPCPEGSHSSEPQMSFCSSCGETYCPQDDCFAGEYFDAAAYTTCNDVYHSCYCLPCEPGTYSQSAGSAKCLECPLGSFAPEQGLSKCLQCGDEEYQDTQGAMACSPCPTNTLRKVTTDGTSVDQCTCKEGYWTGGYSISKERGCVMCVKGGYCAGDNATPIPVAGFWGDKRNIRKFMECSPRSVCEGEFECAEGYDGFLCSECADGFYAIAQECHSCPESNMRWFWTCISLGIQFVVWYLVYWLMSKTQLVVQLVYAMQTLWLFSLLRLQWSSSILHFFRDMAIFGFNAEFVSPGCFLPWSYLHATIIQYTLPILLALVLMLNELRREWRCVGKTSAHILVLSPVKLFRRTNIVRVLLVFVDVGCLPTFVRIWNTFMCEDISEGVEVLYWAPSIECHTAEHAEYIALSVFALFLYGVCWPVIVFHIVFRGKSESKLMDPKFCARFSYIFACYRERWWWYLADWGYRILLSVVAVIGYSQPNLQAVVCVFIAIMSLCIHMYMWPYVSTRLNVLKVIVLLFTSVVMCCGVLYANTSYGVELDIAIYATFTMLLLLAICFIGLDLESFIGVRGLHYMKKSTDQVEMSRSLEPETDAAIPLDVEIRNHTTFAVASLGQHFSDCGDKNQQCEEITENDFDTAISSEAMSSQSSPRSSIAKPEPSQSPMSSHCSQPSETNNTSNDCIPNSPTNSMYSEVGSLYSSCETAVVLKAEEAVLTVGVGLGSEASIPSATSDFIDLPLSLSSTEWGEDMLTPDLPQVMPRKDHGVHNFVGSIRTLLCRALSRKHTRDENEQDQSPRRRISRRPRLSNQQAKCIRNQSRRASVDMLEREARKSVLGNKASVPYGSKYAVRERNKRAKVDDSKPIYVSSILKTHHLIPWLVSESLLFALMPSDAEDAKLGLRNRVIRFVSEAAHVVVKSLYWMFGLQVVEKLYGLDLELNPQANAFLFATTRWLRRVYETTGLDDAASRRSLSDPYVQVASEYGERDYLLIWILQASADERAACSRVLADRIRFARSRSDLIGTVVAVDETLAFLLYAAMVASEYDISSVREFLDGVERLQGIFFAQTLQDMQMELVSATEYIPAETAATLFSVKNAITWQWPLVKETGGSAEDNSPGTHASVSEFNEYEYELQKQ